MRTAITGAGCTNLFAEAHVLHVLRASPTRTTRHQVNAKEKAGDMKESLSGLFRCFPRKDLIPNIYATGLHGLSQMADEAIRRMQHIYGLLAS